MAIKVEVPPPPISVSGWPKELEVPSSLIGVEYCPKSRATIRACGDLGFAIEFATSGLYGAIAIAAQVWSVVQFSHADDMDPSPVNASLKKFTQCCEVVLSRWPFGAELIEEVRSELEEIDSIAGDPSGLWVTLLDDIEIGDYGAD